MFDLLLLFLLANPVATGDLKELWSKLNKPLGFHSSDIESIFAGRVQQFVINKPFGTTVE